MRKIIISIMITTATVGVSIANADTASACCMGPRPVMQMVAAR